MDFIDIRIFQTQRDSYTSLELNTKSWWLDEMIYGWNIIKSINISIIGENGYITQRINSFKLSFPFSFRLA